MLPDLKQAGKKPVPNAGTKLGPGRGCSQMLGMGNFQDFLGKYPVPGKHHSGTQTSTVFTFVIATLMYFVLMLS